ncbi:response regulator transcription factor [Uliginosibacterium sediminicola]
MQNHQRIRILIQYHDPLVAAGLSTILREHADFELVAETDQSSTAPDVLITGYEHGLACITGTASSALQVKPSGVLILTRRDSEWEIRHALECGACGYLTLGCALDELVSAVRSLHRGIPHLGQIAARKMADSIACEPLTAREMDVLRLLVEGHANKTIAKHLGIAAGTVKVHMKSLFHKLEATSRTEVAAVAERRGLLSLPPSLPERSAFHPQSARRYAAPAAFETCQI